MKIAETTELLEKVERLWEKEENARQAYVLNPLPKDRILDMSKLKAFVDDNLNVN